jgi:predicted O-methyltransferase YrrM
MIKHPKDIEYFNMYPTPIMERLQDMHFTNINATIAHLGPMLYFLLRAQGAEKVLEIGHAEGYTSHYLAHAIKDNGTRFGMKDNHYWGVDIAQTEKTRSNLEAEGLPVTVINMDSINITPDTFKGITFDTIFQDGAHDADHVIHEFNVLWPQVKSGGTGYWIAHDVLPGAPAHEGFLYIKALIDSGRINAEYVQLWDVYGMAIIRKI